jgi:2-polyprenyl-6-methoxyphenol hydroxylase-like FAD-dependent oxidoreductase
LSVSKLSVIEGNNYRSLVLFPFQYNGKVRVTLDAGPLSPGEEISKTAAEMTVEKFESLVSECIAPAKFKVLEHTWLTCYGINERRAPAFQHQGRIFLVGDAAHVHSPAGGQGMNTGLQDAYNLAWKLAFVLRGVAPASMLDTYTLERGTTEFVIAAFELPGTEFFFTIC